jgi:UDP-N-acetylglucosamine acyltransferase
VSTAIHETAIISSTAQIGSEVQIGPYGIVDDGVIIGDNCKLEPFVHLKKGTVLGSDNHIHTNAVIGGEPQHQEYAGEETKTVIGNGNSIREFVTVHRGTVQGHGQTTIGNKCMIMAYAHVAHDCILGDEVIMANAVNLAGHVEIGNHAIISGLAACQQFLRVGEYAFLGGSSGYNLDIPPYMLAHGVRGRLMGPNVIGLKRHGFTSETCRVLKKVYKVLFRSGLAREKAIEQVLEDFGDVEQVNTLVDFMQISKNGVAPDYQKKNGF